MSEQEDCLFCRIERGELPSDKIYTDDEIIVFRDINPKTPFHVLVVPRKHIATLNDVQDEDTHLAGRLFLVAKHVAQEAGYQDYRVQMNCGAGSGQLVFHIHLHVMAGQPQLP